VIGGRPRGEAEDRPWRRRGCRGRHTTKDTEDTEGNACCCHGLL
jgi:hypothetical protein